jgi:plastocyanin
MTHSRRWTAFAAPAALLAAVMACSTLAQAPLARAQAGSEAPHPAHIHTGTCENLGDIVVPLTDITLLTAGEVFGAPSAVPVEESETEADMSLSDILASPHAVNIHQSADAIQVYIACGDIGGRVVDGKLAIGLQEINGSGHSGVAILDTAGDQTEVTVYLANSGAGGEAAEVAAPVAATETPAPAPAATATTPPAETETPAPAQPTEAAAPTVAAPAAQEAPVDIREFEFSPSTVEISVGDTVTWTNQGTVPHTATAERRDILQSGAIAPGASFSQVFNEAGEFPYFCEFHPNMTGTIVVK